MQRVGIGPCTLYCADCREVLETLAPNSINLIATDPPYFKVKHEAWDRQWDKPVGFLRWLKGHRDEWHRVLKPNGSLYCFASPRMAARVEVLLSGRFEVLNSVAWFKPIASYVPPYCGKDSMRSWTPMSERIIFAEHYGADNIAKGEAGYAAKCDELRGFVFEPLRKYLDDERKRAGVDFEQVRQIVGCASGSGLPSHWFTRSQWMLPTQTNYEKLRVGFSLLDHGGEYLRREYEDLRREYEDLRRPFNVTADVPYTDVWTFPTVPHGKDKHPCQKPLAMMEHIVTASSRPGELVFDPFMGSATTLVAAIRTGRKAIGIEKDEAYFAIACKRVEKEMAASDTLYQAAG